MYVATLHTTARYRSLYKVKRLKDLMPRQVESLFIKSKEKTKKEALRAFLPFARRCILKHPLFFPKLF